MHSKTKFVFENHIYYSRLKRSSVSGWNSAFSQSRGKLKYIFRYSNIDAGMSEGVKRGLRSYDQWGVFFFLRFRRFSFCYQVVDVKIVFLLLHVRTVVVFVVVVFVVVVVVIELFPLGVQGHCGRGVGTVVAR